MSDGESNSAERLAELAELETKATKPAAKKGKTTESESANP